MGGAGAAEGGTQGTAAGGTLGGAMGFVACKTSSGGSGSGAGSGSGGVGSGSTRKWKLGGNKSAQKWANQMAARGWTPEQIDEAIQSGKQYTATNNINLANGATRYVNPTTGRSVALDNVTGEVIHVGGDGFRY